MFISLIDKNQIKKLYDFLFVHFPDDGSKECDIENPLLNGKQEICSINGVKIGEWDGMDSAIRVTGRLTEEVKAIFYKSLLGRGIWKYSFIRNGNVRVQKGNYEKIIASKQLFSMR